ncbi:hypothetical protein PMAYCL1PPCAC_15930 [Pristionchus mayeri]|uniref:glucuronosyltransferase n=1 Tax=Pristionchus mayeri TaxID=1317129 RepID=A0AAN5HYQ3_9BILA|nr:hypothetical protein PMAYCL1PPCAC_15930 [Pristionchus mayeri]
MKAALLLLLSLTVADSYKILVYNSKFGYSNVQFFGRIADILVEAGHDVTTLLPEIDPSLGDETVKSKKILVPQTTECAPVTQSLSSENMDWFALNSLDPLSILHSSPYSDRFALQCKGTLEETELIDRLKAVQFDVMIAENADMCGIGLSHVLQPKVLINAASSVPHSWMLDEFGIPHAWSYNPSPQLYDHDEHSFWSRLRNLYAGVVLYRNLESSRTSVEELFKQKFGGNFPSLTEISSHAAYTLVNSEPLVDFATPTINRIIYVGGLAVKTPEKLDKKFDDILNARSKTVLISFGTLVAPSKTTKGVKNAILEAVQQFPDVTFIWKYDKPEDDFAEESQLISANLHMIKWAPQNDLLADSRLTAVITHAGTASTHEMIAWGKPGLFIPCFGDQSRNAAMMERAGLGKVFDKRHFAIRGKFSAAVADLFGNTTYNENARRLADMVGKKRSVREKLIETVEFAAEFGATPALRPQSYDMSWLAYHNLDIIGSFCLAVLAGVFVMLQLVSAAVQLCGTPKIKKD